MNLSGARRLRRWAVILHPAGLAAAVTRGQLRPTDIVLVTMDSEHDAAAWARWLNGDPSTR